MEALWPKGASWDIAPNSDLDKLLDGIGASNDEVMEFLSQLASIRDPANTFILGDLEREYGVFTDELFTDAERRERLKPHVYPGEKTGSADHLQSALDLAGLGAGAAGGGYNLQVHINDPPVDPAPFIDKAFQMVAGGDNAFAGFEPLSGPPSTAFAGSIGGEWVVNGDIFTQSPAYTMQAGGDFAFAGNGNAVAGRFDSLNQTPIEYDTPTDPNDWPLVFFVGGDATRNINGELTNIEIASVPTARKNELRRLILRIKPLGTWCGLIVGFS